MRIKTENGIKWISYDNIGEIINEFKKFRTTQIEISRKTKYDDYFLFTC